MPEAELSEPGAEDAAADDARGPVFSRYGILSTALAVVSVVAVVLVGLIWSKHHNDVDELRYRSNVLQAAADWTGVLINMNKDNVDASLQKLHDGTVGELNADFDAAVAPYRDVVQTLQSSTTGQIQSVALESVHHDLDTPPGTSPAPTTPPLPPGIASRTDTVLVIASSVSDNVGGPQKTVRWNLRLDIADVNGQLQVSRLVSMR